jgi:hypothetical protein
MICVAPKSFSLPESVLDKSKARFRRLQNSPSAQTLVIADLALRQDLFHGFYSQSFSVLRSVCELSLLQSSLPEGAIRTEEGVNWVWLLGQRAIKSPSSDVASSIEAWAVDGCKIPPWRDMLKKLLRSDIAREFDQKTKLSARLKEIFDGTNQYVHVRGWQRSAINLRNGGLRLSEESLLLFGTHMMRATQMSISILLLAFLPTATSYADAAAG